MKALVCLRITRIFAAIEQLTDFLVPQTVLKLAVKSTYADSKVPKPEEVGVYEGVDLNGDRCEMKLDTFRLSTYSAGEINRSITLKLKDTAPIDLYFSALVDGMGTMPENNLIPLFNKNGDIREFMFSHLNPNGTWGVGGKVMSETEPYKAEKVLYKSYKGSSEINLNKQFIEVQMKKSLSFQDTVNYECKNLKKVK